MRTAEHIVKNEKSWTSIPETFEEWLGSRSQLLEPGLNPEPTIKVLIFLALVDAEKSCSYDDLREIFISKKVIEGHIPDNTLRTSILNLGRTLEKANHQLELKSFRGKFQLITRKNNNIINLSTHEPKNFVLLTEYSVVNPIDIAKIFIEKSMLPFNALYFLEYSARCWEIYSRQEVEARVKYEIGAWEQLGIKERILQSQNINNPLIIISLGPSEGLAEIALLKKILKENSGTTIHYLAIDSSPRLLRNHFGLLNEELFKEIKNGQLLSVAVLADIFSGLPEAIKKARNECVKRGIIKYEHDFLPQSSAVLITYFGNCLGNEGSNTQDPEAGFFSMIHSIFQNRPLEILLGVSVMRSEPDVYKRNWDDFLLQTPKHLLHTSGLFESSRKANSEELPEFVLSEKHDNRCPEVVPETYLARHQIEGQIYRFYYKLAFDLKLSSKNDSSFLPKGTFTLLYNIIKYNMPTLIHGIEKIGLFKIQYDPNYHQLVNTPNGKREYAVFCAYIDK